MAYTAEQIKAGADGILAGGGGWDDVWAEAQRYGVTAEQLSAAYGLSLDQGLDFARQQGVDVGNPTTDQAARDWLSSELSGGYDATNRRFDASLNPSMTNGVFTPDGSDMMTAIAHAVDRGLSMQQTATIMGWTPEQLATEWNRWAPVYGGAAVTSPATGGASAPAPSPAPYRPPTTTYRPASPPGRGGQGYGNGFGLQQLASIMQALRGYYSTNPYINYAMPAIPAANSGLSWPAPAAPLPAPAAPASAPATAPAPAPVVAPDQSQPRPGKKHRFDDIDFGPALTSGGRRPKGPLSLYQNADVTDVQPVRQQGNRTGSHWSSLTNWSW